MMDNVIIYGVIEIEIDGESKIFHNSIPDSGKNLVLRLLTGENAPIESVKVGSSSTVENHTDTDLGSAIGVAKTFEKFTSGISEVVWETVFGYNEGNGTIREVGLFASDGTLFARKVVPDQTKSSSQTMKVRYKVRVVGG